jgi:hypothetical protein
LAQLSKLKPPADVVGDWDLAIADRRALLPLLQALHEYASRGDTQGYHKTNLIFHQAQYRLLEAAQRSGLEVCARTG